MFARFHDPLDAGRHLAAALSAYAGREDTVILALPRGGVPVGFAVATALHLPLDVFIVRKLGVPGHEELAMGAIASGGVQVRHEPVLNQLPQAEALLEAAARRELGEIERREAEYRQNRPAPDLRGKTVIVVDDGLATGSTMRAAIAALRRHRVGRLVVAVPIGAPDTCELLRHEVDELVCLLRPEHFRAVGQFYEDFSQTTDEEVRDWLARAAAAAAG